MIELDGKNVVVTGKIAGESRQTAEQKLRQAGARVQSSVTTDTHLLVTGANVGATKMNGARAKGVDVVSWEDVWATASAASRGGRRALPTPPVATIQVGPMLALDGGGKLPNGDGWLYEVKWDGYRCVATLDGNGSVAMQSRSGRSEYAERFTVIAAALADADLPACILDGELVVLDEQGASSFAALAEGRGRECFVVFDVLESDGLDLRGWPIEARQEQLRTLLDRLDTDGCIVQSPVFEDGEALMQTVVERGLEGIVAKRRGSRYHEGKRGPDWIKVKVRCEQEFVVVGFTEGKGARAGTAGALVLAVNDDAGDLVYCGNAGSGGTYADFQALVAQMNPTRWAGGMEDLLQIGATPMRDFRDVTWVVPTVVVQVRFQRWTEDGRLWHPSIVGQRTDKSPGDVVREPTNGDKVAA